jgi:NADPH:quinone reductase-like Zn-dependent oxidoreductase
MTTTETDTSTMRAIVQRAYGSAETLELGDVVRPQAGAGEVLIEVRAAGVDRGVWHLMTGLPYLVRMAGFGLFRPKTPIPGLDVAGTVVAVGSNVTRFEVGDEVFGIGSGTYAEFATAKASKLTRKPAGLSFEEAAVSAVSGITALQALTTVAAVAPGQSVLVIGASGGVGSYAVQIAKTMGADVTGVASAAKAELVRSLGADHVIDYATSDYLDGRVRYDVIIDTGGLNKVRHLRRALTRAGTLVIVGGEGGGRFTGGIGRQLRATAWSMFVPQRMRTFISEEHHRHMDRLAELIATGAVKPIVGNRHALEDVPVAIADLAAGRASGKSVVIVQSR